MSEIHDYGLDGSNPVQSNTSSSPKPLSNLDLEAQSPQTPVESREPGNNQPVSPIVSHLLLAISFSFVLYLDL